MDCIVWIEPDIQVLGRWWMEIPDYFNVGFAVCKLSRLVAVSLGCWMQVVRSSPFFDAILFV